MTVLRGVDGGREVEPGAGVPAAVEQLSVGRLVAVVEGGSGYLVTAARSATVDAMVTMATYGHGVLGVTLAPERIAALGLASLGGDGGHHAPVDLVGCARPSGHAARAAVVRALADPRTPAARLCSPGHVFPIAADADGVLRRPRIAEAAADLARIASGVPVSAYVQAVDEGGAAADAAAAGRLARMLNLRIVSVEEVLLYREQIEPAVERQVTASLPTRYGGMTAIGFLSRRAGRREYTAFVRGDLGREARVHLHLSCRPGDVFGGRACGCGDSLRRALAEITAAVGGVIVHTEHPQPLRHLAAVRGPRPLPTSVELEVGQILVDLGVREARISCNEELDPARLLVRPARLGQRR